MTQPVRPRAPAGALIEGGPARLARVAEWSTDIVRRRPQRAEPRRSRPAAQPVFASPVFEALPPDLRRRVTRALLTTNDERGVSRCLLKCLAVWQATPPPDVVRDALVREITRRAASKETCDLIGHLVSLPGFANISSEKQRRVVALLAPAGPELAPSLRVASMQKYLGRLRRKNEQEQSRRLVELLEQPVVCLDLVGSRRSLGHVYVASRVKGEAEVYSIGQRFERARYTLVARRPEPFLSRWPQRGPMAQQLYDRARFRISRWEEHLIIGALEATFVPNRSVNSLEDTRLLELGPETLRLLTFVCAHRQGPEQPELQLQRAGRAALSCPASEQRSAREKLRQMLAQAKRSSAPQVPQLTAG